MSISARFSNILIKTKQRLRNHGVILVYHRVNDMNMDPQLLAVSCKNFSEHMSILSRYYHPTSITSLLKGFENNSIPKGAIAVTFDDGYADNLSNALSILEANRIPATFYLAIGNIINNESFWWDQLESVFLMPNTLRKTLELELNEKRFKWELGDDTVLTTSHWELFRDWNVTNGSFPTNRHLVYYDLIQKLKVQDLAERNRIIDGIWQWSGIKRENHHDHRLLEIKDVQKISCGNGAEIGAHTCHHVLLAALDSDDQEQEINQSRNELINITGKNIDSFAYPYGYKGSYTAGTESLVRECGFKNACANRYGIVFNNTNKYAMPRIICRDWDGETFKAYLMGILEPAKT